MQTSWKVPRPVKLQSQQRLLVLYFCTILLGLVIFFVSFHFVSFRFFAFFLFSFLFLLFRFFSHCFFSSFFSRFVFFFFFRYCSHCFLSGFLGFFLVSQFTGTLQLGMLRNIFVLIFFQISHMFLNFSLSLIAFIFIKFNVIIASHASVLIRLTGSWQQDWKSDQGLRRW